MNTDERLEQIDAEIEVVNDALQNMAGDEMSQSWVEENDALLEYKRSLILERENILENR